MKSIEQLDQISKIKDLRYHSLETAALYLEIDQAELIKIERRGIVQSLFHDGEMLFSAVELKKFKRTNLYRELKSSLKDLQKSRHKKWRGRYKKRFIRFFN